MIIGSQFCRECQKYKNSKNYRNFDELTDEDKEELTKICKENGIKSFPIIINEEGKVSCLQ